MTVATLAHDLLRSLPPAALAELAVQRIRALDGKSLVPREIETLLAWTLHHRAMLKPGRALDFEQHPYLRALYECDAQRLVIYKASQMGASEYLVSYALHAADQRAATVLYVFPTDGNVSDFSSARIGPAIEASPYLASIVVDATDSTGDTDAAPQARRRGADRVTLKRIRNSFLYLRGGKVDPDGRAAQLKSIDADVLVLDELDEMDPRAPVIARKRLDASRLAEQRLASTPTYSGRGIHAEWLESDQREWFVRCEHCGERQGMTIDQVVTVWDTLKRPVAWHGQDEGRAYVACTRCSAELDRLGAGEWVTAYPERDVAGFHLTKLFSATMEVSAIVEALSTTDETKRKEAYNQDLGEPYVPRGGQLTRELLDSCRRDYGHGPVAGERCVMGVDVGRLIHAVIRGERDQETGARPQRWAGTLESFDAVGLMARRYGVHSLVIDALPETTMARELQAGLGQGVAWLAYYATQPQGTRHESAAEWRGEEVVEGASGNKERKWNGVVNLDRTRTLDETMAAFADPQQFTLPADARDIPGYYEHLVAPVRVVSEDSRGVATARYVESGPDHFAHAENYCRVAGEAPRVPPAAGVSVSLPAASYRPQHRSRVWRN